MHTHMHTPGYVHTCTHTQARTHSPVHMHTRTHNTHTAPHMHAQPPHLHTDTVLHGHPCRHRRTRVHARTNTLVVYNCVNSYMHTHTQLRSHAAVCTPVHTRCTHGVYKHSPYLGYRNMLIHKHTRQCSTCDFAPCFLSMPEVFLQDFLQEKSPCEKLLPCRGFGTGCPPLHLAGCRLQGSWVPWMLLRAASASRCEQGRNRGIPGQEDDERPQGIRLIPAPPSCFSYCWCQAASGLGGVGMGLRASSRSDRSMYA